MGSGQDVICSGPAIKFAEWATIGGSEGARADTGAVVVWVVGVLC